MYRARRREDFATNLESDAQNRSHEDHVRVESVSRHFHRQKRKDGLVDALLSLNAA